MCYLKIKLNFFKLISLTNETDKVAIRMATLSVSFYRYADDTISLERGIYIVAIEGKNVIVIVR